MDPDVLGRTTIGVERASFISLFSQTLDSLESRDSTLDTLLSTSSIRVSPPHFSIG